MSEDQQPDPYAGMIAYIIGGMGVGVVLGVLLGVIIPNLGIGFGISIGIAAGLIGSMAVWLVRKRSQ